MIFSLIPASAQTAADMSGSVTTAQEINSASEGYSYVSLADISDDGYQQSYDKDAVTNRIIETLKAVKSSSEANSRGSVIVNVKDLSIAVPLGDNGPSSYNGINDLVESVIDSHPELFFVNGFGGTSYTFEGTAPDIGYITKIEIKIFDDIPEDMDLISETAAMETTAQEIADTIIPESADAVDTALLIHDYIIKNSEYDTDGLNYETENKKATLIHSAYSNIMQGKGVCEGYSKSFNLIWQKAGHPTTQYARSNKMGHLWNIVPIGDTWYHIDLTFDDPISALTGYDSDSCLHNYFMLSDETISELKHYDWTTRGGITCPDKTYESSDWAYNEDYTFENVEINSLSYNLNSGTYGYFSFDNQLNKFKRHIIRPFTLQDNGSYILDKELEYNDLYIGEGDKPTIRPSATAGPTELPTLIPSESPSAPPTPSESPSVSPSVPPTPSESPSVSPSVPPTPSESPLGSPTPAPEYEVTPLAIYKDQHKTEEDVTFDNVNTASFLIKNNTNEILYTDIYVAYYDENGILIKAYPNKTISTSKPSEDSYFCHIKNDAEPPENAAYVSVYLWKLDVPDKTSRIRTLIPVYEVSTFYKTTEV